MTSHRPNSGAQPIRSDFASDPEMSELVELFVSELPERVKIITDAWQDNQYEQLFRVTHQLKGASAGYGFAPVGSAAAAVEDRLRAMGPQADLSSLRQQVDDLVAMCARVIR